VPSSKPSDVRRDITSGTTAPLYLLEGDDPQSRQDLALEFATLVDEGLQAFNVESFHAAEAGAASARDAMIASILGAARTLPMMAPRRVVLVHEAERLLSPKRSKEDEAEAQPELPPLASKRKRAPTPAEDLEAYFERPEAMTTLVFVAGAVDENRRLVKLLRKHGVGVDCGRLESTHDAAGWIQKRLERDELGIEPDAAKLLIELAGLNLGRVRAEVEKLVLYCAGESRITARHVRELVVAQEEPGEDFALGKAIWNGRSAEALREISAQLESGAPPFLVLGQIRAAAARLSPDRKAKAGLDAVLEADLRIKSSTGDPRFVLEHLVLTLCSR
jgi:DNA polymerase-3 subunit delta